MIEYRLTAGVSPKNSLLPVWDKGNGYFLYLGFLALGHYRLYIKNPNSTDSLDTYVKLGRFLSRSVLKALFEYFHMQQIDYVLIAQVDFGA